MTDTKITKGVNEKLPEAFNELFEKLYASLCYYANRIINDREESKDLVAKAFLVLWEKEADFEDMSHLKSYLYAVTRNACLTQIRNSKLKIGHLEKITERYVSEEKQLDRASDETEIIRELYGAIKKLPDRCRQAFILTHLEGYSRMEAADRLGVSEHTVKNQVQVAKTKLRNMIGEKRLSLALLLIHYAVFKN